MSDVSLSAESWKNGSEKRDSRLSVPGFLTHPALLRSRKCSREEDAQRVRTGSLPPVISSLKQNVTPVVGLLANSRSTTASSSCSSTQSSSTMLNRVRISSWSMNRSSSSPSQPWQAAPARSSSIEERNDLTKNGQRKNALVPNDLSSKSLYDLAVKFETLSSKQPHFSMTSASHLPTL
uniref:Uncharacterized protein n=1 Tax=Plectus sambesii TaxID=2011161 RepID=A0A914WTI7_9BILA